MENVNSYTGYGSTELKGLINVFLKSDRFSLIIRYSYIDIHIIFTFSHTKCQFVSFLDVIMVANEKSFVKNPKIMLHRFPKDPILRDCWEKQIHQYGQTDTDRKFINFNSAVVCFLHFANDSYVMSSGIKCRQILKPNAIPLNIHGMIDGIMCLEEEKLCESVVASADHKSKKKYKITLFDDLEVQPLDQSLENKMENIKYYKDFINLEDVSFESRFGNILSQLFTPTQIQLLLHPKKKVYQWTPEDIFSISLAITLRSLSTLRTWAEKFPIDDGILTSVLSLMKFKGDLMKTAEKLTVICFDKTYISNLKRVEKFATVSINNIN
ncbi:hypothetical protein QTP88_008568 [Uroleucon formosanum]